MTDSAPNLRMQQFCGALWMWDGAEDICPDGQQIVDWFHTFEHISKVTHARYPNGVDTIKRKHYLKPHKKHLS